MEAVVNDDATVWNKIKVESKLKSLEKISSYVDELRMDYYNVIPETDDTTDIENELLDIEARIDKLEVGFNQLSLNENKSSDNSNCHNKSSKSCKLPEIPLPQFTGKYEEWNMFKTEFSNIVANNKQLSDMQKLHYLHAALKGEAKLLQNPEDTFESLFTALEKRFENKKIIVNIHVKALLEFETISHESSKELRNLVDAINKNIRALKNLGFERNDLSDILLTTIILNKLDKETRKQFELSMNNSEVPKFEDLITYLEKRSQTLESVNKYYPVKPKVVHENKSKTLLLNSNSLEKKCLVCENGFHSIYKCYKFRNMSANERFNVVKRNKLCLNCLKGNHLAAECKSTIFCATCSRKHHTLLHRDESFVSNQMKGGKQDTAVCLDEKKLPAPLDASISTQSCLFSSNRTVILPTAIVLIKDSSGNLLKVEHIWILVPE